MGRRSPVYTCNWFSTSECEPLISEHNFILYSYLGYNVNKKRTIQIKLHALNENLETDK
jgi:hypothetical protein